MEQFSALWPISDIPSQYISIYEGPAVFLKDYAAATPIHRTIFAAYWMQGEVLNGGLSQFFGNSTGVLAPEAVEACRVLNLPRLAAKLQEAMNWFGSTYPRDRGARESQLEAAAESDLDPFDKLDVEVSDLIYEESAGPGSFSPGVREGTYVLRAMTPNPSVEARPNGIALGPRGAKTYDAPRGPSAMPSVPPHLER